MTGAMYAAVSGIRAHMNKLNVIGNNIANVNTAGYKAGRVTFTESLYTTMKGGSNGTDVLGGTNPAQIGYGSQIGTIDLDMSTKNYSPTGRGLDCMIDGDGFFMVGDKTGGITADNVSSLDLTRVGNLDFKDGYLVDGQGRVVYGFLSAAAADGSNKADYTNGDQTAGISTELTPIRLPLAAGAPTDPTDPDAIKEGSAIYPTVVNGVTEDAATGINGEGKRIQLTSVSIDKTGKITGINKATEEPVVIGYVALASVDSPNGVTHTGGPYYKAMGGAGDVRVSTVGSAVKGYLNNQVAGGAGLSSLDMIQGGGGTELISGGLESSGTDLAAEITEMITTQRGYQANTRIVTVTDSMLEELVNMKR